MQEIHEKSIKEEEKTSFSLEGNGNESDDHSESPSVNEYSKQISKSMLLFTNNVLTYCLF